MIPTIINLIASLTLNKEIKMAEISKGNKQYPKRQKIWKILVLTPKKFALRKGMTPPIQKIRKTKIIIWLLFFELIAKVQAKIKFNNKGPHKSHCFM